MTIETILPSLGRAALFLGIPFVLLIFYMQWKWAKTCANNIRVLVAQKGGGGAWKLAPKEGGSITITDKDDVTRTWPVNELATIDVLYPGVGFVPGWMQKTIRMAIVNEGDWEPMLNRSPHRERIASPDVVAFLRQIAEHPNLGKDIKVSITKLADSLCTGPTREMIADPSTLGALRKSSVLKALASVSNEFMDTLKAVQAKLARMQGAHPWFVYIGISLNLVLTVYIIYTMMQSGDAVLLERMSIIEKALGIVPTIPGVTP